MDFVHWFEGLIVKCRPLYSKIDAWCAVTFVSGTWKFISGNDQLFRTSCNLRLYENAMNDKLFMGTKECFEGLPDGTLGL